jgi:hypothetical protein
MTIRQLPFPVNRNGIWNDQIAATIEGFRANGIKEFGIEVQQIGLQKVLYEFQELGFLPYKTIKTSADPEDYYDIERYVLVLRDVSESPEHKLAAHTLELETAALDAIRKFDELNSEGLPSYDDYRAPTIYGVNLQKAAAVSCAMTEAYAIMAGLGYDDAAQYLHDKLNGESYND